MTIGDFFKITNVQDQKSLANRIAQLGRLPYFEASDSGFLERAAPFFKLITYQPGDTIVVEGTDNLDLYWILKGTCKVCKLVPFIQKKSKTVNRTLAPYLVGAEVREDEEITMQVLTVQEIGIGDYFPRLPVAPNLDEYMMAITFKKEEYLDFIENLDPGDVISKSAHSIVAISKLEVAAIPKLDFLKISSTKATSAVGR